MNLDEAIAVYLFLQHRAPGATSPSEREAQALAWEVICEQAGAAINRSRDLQYQQVARE